MPTPVLYRKWRPQTLSQVVGQDHVTRTLLNALSTGRVSHAYLFCGPRGTGKTSTARILAKAVNCLTDGRGEPCGSCAMCEAIAQGRALDLVEMDAASNRGIEDIRDLRNKINFAPNEARYKVYVVDEVHMLTDPAFNALLKTLEEPPPHAIFVLATTEVHRVPMTILSRCQRFDFRRIPQQALVDHLATICQAEHIEAETAALELIARSASGSARDAVNLLEQVEVAYGAQVRLADLQTLLGLTGDPRSVEVVKAVVARNLGQGMALIQKVREDGANLPQFGREVAEHLRTLLLLKAGAPEAVDAPPELVADLRSLAASVGLDEIVRATKAFSQLDFHGEGGSSLPLELALVDALPVPQSSSAALTAPTAPEGRRSQGGELQPASQGTSRQAPTVPVTSGENRPVRPPAPRPLPSPAAPTERPAPPKVEARTPAVPSPGPTRSAAGEPDLAQLRQLIKEVRIPQMRFIESLLRNGCTLETVEGQTLTLGFKPGLTSHKERMERPENLRLVEQALKELTGTEFRIRCIVLDAASAPIGSDARGHLVNAALEAGARRVSPDS